MQSCRFDLLNCGQGIGQRRAESDAMAVVMVIVLFMVDLMIL